jgi:hypothetical protein
MHNCTRASRAAALVAATLAALTLGGTVPAVSDQPASTAARPAAPPHIDPAALSRGADPKIPYLLGHRIRDGERSIRIAKAPNHLDLWETAGGYVVVDNFPRAERTFRITAISASGKRSVLARPQFVAGSAVSPRGHRFAWSDQTGDLAVRSVIRVVNPRTGTLIAKRVFRNASVELVTDKRVLLTRTYRGDNTTTTWWNYRTDRVRQLSDKVALRADYRQGVVVLANRIPSRCTQVARLAYPSKLLWRSCGITPHAWSPNGRHALATNIYFDMPGTDRWVITNGRTGKRLARVTGRLDWDIAWEDNRHFLAQAQSDSGKSAVIRCDLQARCERAGRLWNREVDEDQYFVGPPVVLASN